MYFALLLVEKQEKSPTGAKSPWKSMRRGSDVELLTQAEIPPSRVLDRHGHELAG